MLFTSSSRLTQVSWLGRIPSTPGSSCQAHCYELMGSWLRVSRGWLPNGCDWVVGLVGWPQHRPCSDLRLPVVASSQRKVLKPGEKGVEFGVGLLSFHLRFWPSDWVAATLWDPLCGVMDHSGTSEVPIAHLGIGQTFHHEYGSQLSLSAQQPPGPPCQDSM